MESIEEFGVPFAEHVQHVLEAMQGIADKLGVGGQK
jgi:predicted hydrolase (HD superfamily)